MGRLVGPIFFSKTGGQWLEFFFGSGGGGFVGFTLPETNIAHENPIFPGKYHQNGGFSMAMLVYRSVGC